jgi:hypothetical protein
VVSLAPGKVVVNRGTRPEQVPVERDEEIEEQT